ncbi:MAG: nucleotide exchange factor GrpE [Blautia sp.]|nr:nucleotide exchange factor GrpE [Blautia sp.]
MFFRGFRSLLQTVLEKTDRCIEKVETIEALQKENTEKLEALRHENTARTAASQPEPVQEKEKLIESIERELSDFRAGIERHDMAIEDMLEEWDELKSRDEEKKRIMDGSKSLLDTLIAYHDQFFFLRSSIGADHPDWMSQISMMEYLLEKKRITAGLYVIQETNVPADFELHEVSSIKSTDDEKQHGIIAEILNPGYVYNGKTIRKALVTVYRFEG